MKVSLFSQVLALIDRNIFNKLVRMHESDKYSKGVITWTHFVSILFMQMAEANSLRDISHGLRSATGYLIHLGVHRSPSKSTLSYINFHRNYEVFMDLYFALLDRMEPSLARRRKYGRRLKRKNFIMDASVIPLCLSLFDWAKFLTRQGAVKLHAVLDYDTVLPSYAVLSDGKTHDLEMAKETVFPAESVLVVERAYVDFEWLNNLDSTGVLFVTRLKSNAAIEVVESFLTNEKHNHILSDEDIRMTEFYTQKNYPDKLRVGKVWDEENQKSLLLLTNQLSWTAHQLLRSSARPIVRSSDRLIVRGPRSEVRGS